MSRTAVFLGACLVVLAPSCRDRTPKPVPATIATRVAALSPASAEILCAVGCCGKIVVRSSWADYPQAVLTAPAYDGLYPSAEALLAFRPDLVVLNYPPPALQSALQAAKIGWIAQSPRTVAEIGDNIAALALACGAAGAGQRAAGTFRDAVAQAQQAATGRPTVKVFVELDAGDGRRPFTIGHGSFVDDVVTLAGGRNVFAQRPETWFAVDIEALLAADPDVVVLGDSDVNTNPQTLETLKARPGFGALRAVKAGKVVALPGSWLSRPGPRVALAVAALAAALHAQSVPRQAP